MRTKHLIHVVSCHAEGEVGDVIVGGVAPPPGATLWEQSRFIAADGRLRDVVLNEPRGGVFRHVNLLVPPDLGNIFDLPPDLLDELSIANTDALEDQLVTVVNAYGGTATLDQILVGLYRKFGISQKRRFVQNKLYRMPMVWSIPGKKGVYSTAEPQPLTGPKEEAVLVEDDDDIFDPTIQPARNREDD